MADTGMVHIDNQQLAVSQYTEVSVLEVQQRRHKIVGLMKSSMADGVDYGVIPGCAKPTLYQPGAQKLLNMFHLDPEFARESDSVMEKDFILHSYRCTIYHIPTQLRVASGVGSCNSREDKYGMRHGNRKCPECSKETIIAGKPEYGGGWVCFKKKGGCGYKFDDHDPLITSQPVGKVPNENIYEQENTIRKMAQKRALIAACLNATGASDIFTQDIEDMPEFSETAQDAKSTHREGNEHRTDFCADCQALKLPANCYVVMRNGCYYMRDLNKEPLDHDVFCPNPKCVKMREVEQEVAAENQDAEPDWNAASAAPQAPPVNQAAQPVCAGPVISEPQAKRLFAISKGAKWATNDLKNYLHLKLGVESTRDIPKSAYKEVCEEVERGTGILHKLAGQHNLI
jgi:hypothetical protein